MTVRELDQILETIAPKAWALSFDKVGLQIGSMDWPAKKVAVSLDSSLGAVRFAQEIGADVLLAHHPLIWDPIKTIDADNIRHQAVMELIQNKIAFIAAHTNWDCAPNGLNDALASKLDLSDVRPFGSANPLQRYKLVTFVPEKDAESLVDALSEAGAGRIGEYERCAFLSSGTGTFRGLAGTNPTIGEPGRVESVEEIRIEMVLDESLIPAVMTALRRTHPYEEPAFDLVPLSDSKHFRAGRIGRLPRVMSAREFDAYVNEKLETLSMTWDGGRPVEWVGVVGGAAADDWRAAKAAGADLFLSGEVPQHIALEAGEAGLSVTASGHYATEHPGCAHLVARLQEQGVDAHLFTPEPGCNGRPIASSA